MKAAFVASAVAVASAAVVQLPVRYTAEVTQQALKPGHVMTSFVGVDHDLERQTLIDEVNSKEGVTWKAGHNDRFKGTPVHSHKALCGVKVNYAGKMKPTGLKKVSTVNANIPDAFDSETNWPACAKVIGDIRDQSNCGCCWAFAGAEAASDRLCIATQGKVALPLSAQETCFCASDNGCNGGYVEDPWNYISQVGLTTGGQYNNTGALGGGYCSAFSLPHCHHHGPQGNDPYPAENTPGCPSQTSPQCPNKCDSGAQAPHNNFQSDRYTFDGQTVSYSSPAAIQTAIMNQGPVEAAFTVYADFANYVSGVYSHVSGSMEGGHAIRIVGWGTDSGVDYWKVANSWNPYWGENGYFRIKRGNDECGIEDSVVANDAGATWHQGA
jgi:cathepsin B